jgi:hypothetical protein
MARAHHLHEDRLLDCYVAERAGEGTDPVAAEHLLECGECASRYAEFARFLDALRDEGEAEADGIFTSERLRTQQQHIMRRIESVGRPARVISFPGRSPRPMTGVARRVAPRWLAAAAAAGLFVGVAVGGTLFDSAFRARPTADPSTMLARTKPARRMSAPPPVRVTSPASVVTAAPGPTAAAFADDDKFLFELENALQHPRTRELQPYDALTPHVRDISNALP